jgi:hypothetical protein
MIAYENIQLFEKSNTKKNEKGKKCTTMHPKIF